MSNAVETETVRIGHTPDADDAFMFYGFATGQSTIPGCQIAHVLEDIQALNRRAASDDPLEVTALSVHAYLGLQDRYELLHVGTSVGRGYGPKLVSARAGVRLEDLRGASVALPGEKTTATLVARLLLPPFVERQVEFTAVDGMVSRGEVDAGVIIHEGQLTYEQAGLHLVADLGVLFSERNGGLPLPLGVNCIRTDIPVKKRKRIAAAYEASIRVALEQRGAAVEYSSKFGRGASIEILDEFVGMYVNQDSLGFGADLIAAIEVLRAAVPEASRHHAGASASDSR